MIYSTTFNTPFRRFGLKKMPFDFTVAGDAFQYKLNTIFSKLKLVNGITDNMIIWGENRSIKPELIGIRWHFLFNFS